MRILVLSSYSKSLLWFRMNLMDEFVASGHEVFAMGDDQDASLVSTFAEHGVSYRAFPVSRNGLSPMQDLRTYFALRRSIRQIAPDKIFVYQAKTIVYGCLAARGSDVYALVAGLGSVLRGEGWTNRLVASFLRGQYKRAFRRCERVFLQNVDDVNELVTAGVLSRDRVVMINGSGVDTQRFNVVPLPEAPTFLFIGRLLRDKGVTEYLGACAELRRRHPDVSCLLVGPYDSNPSSLTPGQLRPYIDEGVVRYLGELTDVRAAIAQCSVLVLPSYHEGTPKSVLEAMAMGRAVITTDAPGCRETVADGKNGLLVPPRSVEPLVRAMEAFASQPRMAWVMGAESRAMAEDKYDVRKVNRVIMRAMGVANCEPGVSLEASDGL